MSIILDFVFVDRSGELLRYRMVGYPRKRPPYPFRAIRFTARFLCAKRPAEPSHMFKSKLEIHIFVVQFSVQLQLLLHILFIYWAVFRFVGYRVRVVVFECAVSRVFVSSSNVLLCVRLASCRPFCLSAFEIVSLVWCNFTGVRLFSSIFLSRACKFS